MTKSLIQSLPLILASSFFATPSLGNEFPDLSIPIATIGPNYVQRLHSAVNILGKCNYGQKLPHSCKFITRSYSPNKQLLQITKFITNGDELCIHAFRGSISEEKDYFISNQTNPTTSNADISQFPVGIESIMCFNDFSDDNVDRALKRYYGLNEPYEIVSNDDSSLVPLAQHNFDYGVDIILFSFEMLIKEKEKEI